MAISSLLTMTLMAPTVTLAMCHIEMTTTTLTGVSLVTVSLELAVVSPILSSSLEIVSSATEDALLTTE